MGNRETTEKPVSYYEALIAEAEAKKLGKPEDKTAFNVYFALDVIYGKSKGEWVTRKELVEWNYPTKGVVDILEEKKLNGHFSSFIFLGYIEKRKVGYKNTEYRSVKSSIGEKDGERIARLINILHNRTSPKYAELIDSIKIPEESAPVIEKTETPAAAETTKNFLPVENEAVTNLLNHIREENERLERNKREIQIEAEKFRKDVERNEAIYKNNKELLESDIAKEVVNAVKVLKSLQKK
jgi:hypothetical protein